MDAIKAADLVELFGLWKDLFAEQREYLIALDGKVGDSDLGITMSKSFAAAAETIAALGETAGLAKLLLVAGATIARTAPSTMGTLTATGFLRASKAVGNADRLGTAEISAFWEAFRDSVLDRGKVKLGDKTLLDVLYPVARDLQEATRAGRPLVMALSSASIAAGEALEATKPMVAQHGKAAAFREKTIGLQDAGATVMLLLVKSMAEFVSGKAQR